MKHLPEIVRSKLPSGSVIRLRAGIDPRGPAELAEIGARIAQQHDATDQPKTTEGDQ